MQYKKDEIKEKIDLAALIVFAEKGYSGTKISDIAEKACISVGNIYRYYRSKDEIFYTVVPQSFLVSVRSLLVDKIIAIKGKSLELIEQSDEFWLVNHEVIRFMVENRERILIVFHNSQGTKYEDAKTQLVNFLLGTVKENYTARNDLFLGENKADLVVKIIYENLINMMLRILQDTKDIEEVKQYLKSINSYHLFGITRLFR